LTKVKARTTTKTSAIFLVIVLITGTFALSLSSPSSLFIIGDVQAQEEYGYDDNEYGYSDNNGYSSEYTPSNSFDKNFYPPKDPPADIIVPIDFPIIQQAIDAADEGDVIKVLPGTYTEQINITKSLTIIGSGAKSTVIEAPLVLDTNVLGFTYIVEVNNGAEVSMKGFTIKGPDGADCPDSTGVSVLDGGILNLNYVANKGCTQHAIWIGGPEEIGHATITNTFITDYQDHGVFALGPDATVTMSYNKVVGSSPDVFPVVGIFIVEAKGTITHNEVNNNICNLDICGPDWFNNFQAFGIGAIEAGEGSVISNNYVSNNDGGISVGGASGCCIVDLNKLVDNEFFGIVIADSEQTVSNTKIFGGEVGAAAAATFFNTTATLDHVKIVGAEIPIQALSTGNLTAAVNVLSPSFFAP
jgi:parallel beta-helix repeat protein